MLLESPDREHIVRLSFKKAQQEGREEQQCLGVGQRQPLQNRCWLNPKNTWSPADETTLSPDRANALPMPVYSYSFSDN